MNIYGHKKGQGWHLNRRLNATTALGLMVLIAAPVSALSQEASSQAQTTATATAAAPEPEAVVVVGTRASQQSAINRKKRNGTVSDSIVADDIAQFPDKNVGEALGRITGVQLSRDFGEGSGVSIRGVEPDLNRVEINGMSTLSTAGNLSVYGGGGRSNDFRELAAELVQSIDVFKGFTADMTEGGVGGTVSVKTRRPLDFRKPTLSLTYSAQNLDTADGWKPRINVFATRKFLNDKLGLMANITYDDVSTRGDYVRNSSWARLIDFDNSAEKTAQYYNLSDTAANVAAYRAITSKAGCEAAYAAGTQRTNCLSQWNDYNPRVARYGVWLRNEQRLSAEFTAQYKFTDKIDGFVSYNRNERNQTLNDINYGTDFTSATRLYDANPASTTNPKACLGTPNTAGSVVDANHNVLQYTAGNCLATAGRGGSNAFSISSRDFASESYSNYIGFGANYRGERLQVEFMGSTAETETVNETNNVSVSYNVPGLVVTLDPSSGNPSFTFPAGMSPADASAVSQWQIQYRPSNARNQEDQYKLDFDYTTNLPIITKLEFGLRATDFETSGYGYGGFLLSAGSDLTGALDDTVIYTNAVNATATVLASQTADQTAAAAASAAYTTGFWSTTENWSRSFSNSVFQSAMAPIPTNFYFGGGGIPSSWMYPTFKGVSQYLDTSHFNLDNLETTVGNDGKTYNQIPYRIGEKTDAQYIKFNYEFPLFTWDVNGNFGWRRVHTQTQASGVVTRQEIRLNASNVATTYTTGNTETSMTKDYTIWLPSFNIGVWFKPNVLSARAGFADLMARPLLGYLTPNVTCTINYANDGASDDGPDSCTGGNPSLKPYRAKQYDLSFEYYPNRDSQITAGFFYKDIKTFYVSSRSPAGLVDYFGDGVLYTLNTYLNGSGAKISGLELTAKSAFSFLPGWMSGFGTDMNYTYQKAEDVGLYSQLDGSPLPFPGLSTDSYNATLWYDKGEYSARLAYNYRSKWLVSAADTSGQPIFRDPTGYLDGKFTWKPKSQPGVSYFVEGKNLTKQEERSTAGDIRLTELGYFGRRFFVGVTIKR